MNAILLWTITAGAILGVLFRPKAWPEAIWSCLGSMLLVVFGLLPLSHALAAIGKGTSVYLFLTGMMLLAELARREGVFDWLAGLAVRSAKGSRSRLFALIFVVGIFVTVFLSNDATAVVLTPAVYAAVKKTRSEPLPYLFICAFIANAASFVLPISNPANLVVYGKSLPPLLPWLRVFFLPSLCSIGITYLALRRLFRRDLEAGIEDGTQAAGLSRTGRRAIWGIAATGAVLLVASAFGLELGLPTCIAAVIAVLFAVRARGRGIVEVIRGVSWSVLPLVAGLFVLVEALDRAGARKAVGQFLRACSTMPKLPGSLISSFGVAALSNLMNNLPSGLLAGGAIEATHVPNQIRDAVLIGIDLGPNLSVAGSLATVLWLIALRREGVEITGWRFFKAGIVVMLPALLLATAAMSLLSQ